MQFEIQFETLLVCAPVLLAILLHFAIHSVLTDISAEAFFLLAHCQNFCRHSGDTSLSWWKEKEKKEKILTTKKIFARRKNSSIWRRKKCERHDECDEKKNILWRQSIGERNLNLAEKLDDLFKEKETVDDPFRLLWAIWEQVKLSRWAHRITAFSK